MTSPSTAATAPLPVLQTQPLGPLWPTMDPFLFCAHHDDAYPAGDGAFAPAVPLEGRQIGSDFSRKDGWSMYHGDTVPGFPGHPHRGFETVTLVRKGLIDHADSLGAAARLAGAMCSGSRQARAFSTRKCSRCSTPPSPTRSNSSRSG